MGWSSAKPEEVGLREVILVGSFGCGCGNVVHEIGNIGKFVSKYVEIIHEFVALAGYTKGVVMKVP
jgi:hypothetical protein